jgi:hypothetical protein
MTVTAQTTFRTGPGRPDQAVPETSFRGSRADVNVEVLQIQATGGRFESGLMNGVSLISRGEALGHGMWIDEVALDQVESLGQLDEMNGGIKSRFTHPSMSSDGTGKHLGRIHDIGRFEDRVIGDLHLSESSHKTPDGDLADYVMTLAKEDPRAAGLSIVFQRDLEMESDFLELHGAVQKEDQWGAYWDLEAFSSPDPDNTQNFPHVRVNELRAADVVDEPAANPDGLFDRQPQARQMDALLSFALGLSKTKPPSADALGIDPERASQFLHRWMGQHGVQFLKPEEQDMAIAEPTPAPIETDPAPTREELRAEFTAELNRYTEAFGAENGTKWFHDDLDFTEAQAHHIAALTAERDALAEQVSELEAKLSDVVLGEIDPIDTDGPQDGAPAKTKLKDFCQVPGQPSDN